MNVRRLMQAGLVRRWHTNPDLAHSGETNGHHQWVVVALILSLNPDPSPALVREAAFHDVGEVDAGDLSAPFKDANPAIADDHARYELARREAICGVIWLDGRERDWLKLCDRLAAYLWMLHAAPRCIEHPDWIEQRLKIDRMADEIGVRRRVSELIVSSERGW